ncbi:MAG: hypothetical protein KC615_03030 [Anaerolineae bacterium]|nr:hypothetical protein [Anaerolineae bacterium]
MNAATGIQSHVQNWDRWRAECARVLYGNLLDWDVQKHLQFRYTAPAKEKGKYLPQWLWDSCFHAITYRWFDTVMAWEELLSLLVHQVQEGDDAGMIPHMQHLDVVNDKAAQGLFRQSQRSTITQPPLIAVAAWEVFQKAPNTEKLQEIYAACTRYHEWFDRRRADRDGLIVSIHPWETGWDASQRWDALLGVEDLPKQNKAFSEALKNIRWQQMTLLEDVDYDWRALLGRDAFCVKPIDWNAIRVADLRAMSKIAAALGYNEKATEWTAKADLIAATIADKMIYQVDGHIVGCDLVWEEGIEKPSQVDTAAKFVLLFGQCVDDRTAAMLVVDMTAESSPYHTPFWLTTTPTNNPSFDGKEYWRGNVWMSLNWLIYTGLRHYDFDDVAQELAFRSLELVDQSGFCEFFDPISGERGEAVGVPCPQNQSWTAVVLDMLATEKQRLS